MGILRQFILIFIFSTLAFIDLSRAQGILHTSVMMNSNLLMEQRPGYDITLIFNRKWGFRYSENPETKIIDSKLEIDNSQLSTTSVEGNLKHLTILRALDFRTYDQSGSTPFDFLTAYWGVGYSQNSLDFFKTEYQAQSGQLILSESSDRIEVSTFSLSIGFYGGEKSVVVDTRLQYLRSVISNSDLLDQEIEVNQWKILIAIGLGY